jgi:peptide deformylase
MDSLRLLDRDDQILSRKAEAILDFADPEFQTFIDELIRCGDENMGVGIAAPQVGRSLRLFILAPKPSIRYPDAPTMAPMAVINPEILRAYGGIEKGWEGCLSVPGYRGFIPRHTLIDVAFTDRFGQRRTATYADFTARVFQHEYDHLEGILFPQRLEKGDPLVTVEEYGKLTGISVGK